MANETNLPDWIIASAEIAQAVAVIFGLVIAYRGLYQWRREQQELRNAECAEEILLAVNAAKGGLRAHQAPLLIRLGRRDPQTGTGRNRKGPKPLGLGVCAVRADRI
jgi:hypothetical protein